MNDVDKEKLLMIELDMRVSLEKMLRDNWDLRIGDSVYMYYLSWRSLECFLLDIGLTPYLYDYNFGQRVYCLFESSKEN